MPLLHVQMGFTALHWCAQYGFDDLARQLLCAGAQPEPVDQVRRVMWGATEAQLLGVRTAAVPRTCTALLEPQACGKVSPAKLSVCCRYS